MRFEYEIAWRHLTRRRKAGFVSLISLISVLGVAVGVMALIVVLAVMSGFDRDLKAKIVGIHPHLTVEQVGGVALPDEVIQRIDDLQLASIKNMAPFVQGQAIVRSSANAIGAYVRGVDAARADLHLFHEGLRTGTIQLTTTQSPDNKQSAPIVIGAQLARILGVTVGEELDVVSPVLEKTLLGKRARTATFQVSGVFEVGMSDFDTSLALVPLETAQALFDLQDRVSGIDIKLHDVDMAMSVKPVLQEALGYRYWLTSWMDRNQHFFSALKVEKTVMTILLLLIILVAAFNIASTLIMVVMEKTRDIGILRALGASAGSIKKIFLLEGFVVGCIGVVVGSITGLLLAWNLNPIADFVERTTGLEVFPSNIYYLSQIPTEINRGDVALVICIALLLSLLAGIYPARRAVRLTPVEAIRYE